MVSFVIQQQNLSHFLNSFSGMSDIVLNITNDGVSASGTMERSFFIKKNVEWREGESCEEEGSVAIGQLDLFKSLLNGAGSTLTIKMKDDTILISGDNLSFTLPPIADAHSQQGVDVVSNMIEEAKNGSWEKFGDAVIDYDIMFEAKDFQDLRNVGKAIQQGALYSVEVDKTQLILTVVRDQIRVVKELTYGEYSSSPDDATILWFGKWLMDALKAMPGKGTVHVYGGEDSPLIIRHEAPDNEAWGTLCVIAPRQESGDEV